MKPILHVFLDVDGVLNNEAAFELNTETIVVLSHENLVVYQWLIDKLNEKYEVEIILSSSWRMYKTCVNKIHKYAKKYPALKYQKQTPDSHKMREDEILEYCKVHDIDSDSVLIIDDELITNELKDRHLHTYVRDGLTFKDAEECLHKLGILEVNNYDIFI